MQFMPQPNSEKPRTLLVSSQGSTDNLNEENLTNQDQLAADLIAQRQTSTKPWAEMNQIERKRRIRQLWNKVRRFVRLRGVIKSVEADIEERQYFEHFDPKNYDLTSNENADSESTMSEEEQDVQETQTIPWYQFNTVSFTVKVWDCFFGLIVLVNIIVTPLSICFP